MIETQISILVNRKSDAELIKKSIIKCKIQFPIYLFEYDEYLEVNFTSDYEEWELNTEILKCFPEYEFTENLNKGRKEIRLQLSRYQSEFCTDGWGRPIENPLNETKYLIKKSKSKLKKFNPNVTVLFDDKEQNYYVNIVDGINKQNDETGFLLLNEFRKKDVNNEFKILKDRLYKTPIEAFRFGHLKMENIVKDDFELYLKNKKKEKRSRERIPRKKVREFIKGCNVSDFEEIKKNLDKNFIFEKKVKWKTESIIEGIDEFEKHIQSTNQDLCSMNFKIRSSWNINLPNSITIGVKYFPDLAEQNNMNLKYREYIFEFREDKIIRVTEEK